VNPLNYKYQGPRLPPLIMTMRLDGPQSGTARDIILASLKAEATGLRGQVCLDSRGLPAIDAKGRPDPYGAYDQTIRNLAKLLNDKTRMSVTIDETDKLLPAHSVNDVAIYWGWYSPQLYVPSCRFVPGAFAAHIASYTMTSLRTEGPQLWARGLLDDGAAGTFGPVAEPYLHSFPPADEFVPLLLTGKLTLAEVYWKTTPLSSWMITMIGDPLYTPYKVNPQLKIEDLPKSLQAAFETGENKSEQPGNVPGAAPGGKASGSSGSTGNAPGIKSGGAASGSH
jgi:uncharacterized protein (TIGR03790 family)